MPLQIILDINTINDAFRREIAPGVEEREEGLVGQAAVVRGPDHGGDGGGVRREGGGVFGVDDGGLGGGEVAGVDAAGEEGPVGRAGAA